MAVDYTPGTSGSMVTPKISVPKPANPSPGIAYHSDQVAKSVNAPVMSPNIRVIKGMAPNPHIATGSIGNR